MEIYKITNKVTGKIYIGSTKYSKDDRWIGHLKDAKQGDTRPLYEDIRYYGSDSFDVVTLVELDESTTTQSELEKIEYAVIQEYPADILYNINTSDSMQSARESLDPSKLVYDLQSQGKGVLSSRSVEKRTKSKRYVYTYKSVDYVGIEDLRQALITEGYELSHDVVKHLAQKGQFSKANRKRYPELIGAITVTVPYPRAPYRSKNKANNS